MTRHAQITNRDVPESHNLSSFGSDIFRMERRQFVDSSVVRKLKW